MEGGKVSDEEPEIKKILEEESLRFYDERSKLYELSHGQINYFYASSVFQCPRKIFFDFKTGRPKFSSQTCRIFDNGEAVHERLCKYLRASKKIKFQEEVPIEHIVIGDSSIHGRVDGWVTFNDSGKEQLLEFKSINADSLVAPKKEHVAQVTLYMGATGVHNGSVVYESKRNNKIFEFEIKYDKGTYDEAVKFFADVKVLIDNNTIPEVNYAKDRYPCSWNRFQGKCVHFERCHGQGIQRTRGK